MLASFTPRLSTPSRRGSRLAVRSPRVEATALTSAGKPVLIGVYRGDVVWSLARTLRMKDQPAGGLDVTSTPGLNGPLSTPHVPPCLPFTPELSVLPCFVISRRTGRVGIGAFLKICTRRAHLIGASIAFIHPITHPFISYPSAPVPGTHWPPQFKHAHFGRIP
jgi:hypothetical protein